MKSSVKFLLAGAVAVVGLVCAGTARAQSPVLSSCIGGGVRQLTCRGGCGQTYYTAPSGTDYDNNGHYMLCCGATQVYSVGGVLNGCTSASLRTKESKEMLAKLSGAGVRLMVRNCQGHFVSYTPTDTHPDPFKQMFSIDATLSQRGAY